VPGPIYLDHHATTPPDPRVLERMTEVARDHFGNPASQGHPFGWAAAKIVATSRFFAKISDCSARQTHR